MLFKIETILLSVTTREDQPDADLLSVENQTHALVSNKQKRPAKCWLTFCSNPRACSCQQQTGRASQMLTCMLFKTQSILLWAISRKGQPDADLHPVQNPEHSAVRNKQERQVRFSLTSCSKPDYTLVNNKWKRPARCWLTSCSKPKPCPCQQQAKKASQMLTYRLFKTQTMLLSATSREDPMLTYNLFITQSMLLSATSSNGQMLTYKLFKTQSMLLSATSRKSQPDADLQPVQNPEQASISNKQEEPARCWLTSCSKPRACFCQQQEGRASQMLTYILFKTQSMLLSATSSKGQPDTNLQTVQNPEHAPVSSKQERPARCWLTACSKLRGALVRNNQEG